SSLNNFKGFVDGGPLYRSNILTADQVGGCYPDNPIGCNFPVFPIYYPAGKIVYDYFHFPIGSPTVNGQFRSYRIWEEAQILGNKYLGLKSSLAQYPGIYTDTVHTGF